MELRFLPASDRALLIECADLAATLALFDALQAAPIDGVDEAIPAARTVLLHYQPTCLSAQQLVQAVRLRVRQLPQDGAQSARGGGRLIDIPVDYHGADLESLAALLQLSPAELIERHTGSEYQGAFAGFAPGFVYLSGGDPCFARVPRLPSPRTRVPARSVALAGHFSAIYPKDSPGGWQLIGTTPLELWDLNRAEPALIQPGFRVRFHDRARGATSVHLPPAAPPTAAPTTPTAPALVLGDGPHLHFSHTGLQTLTQDLGRVGQTHMGVSASGALDHGALRAANRLVGNPSDAAVLENLLGQLRFTCHGGSVVVAITGAQAPIQITTAQGRVLPARTGQALALDDGDSLHLGAPSAGVRCYLAVRGGFGITPVLGSCASDTLAEVGPPPLRPGDRLSVGRHIPAARLSAVAADDDQAGRPLPQAGDTVTLDIVLGPRSDWFTPESLALLAAQEWTVTPQSNRVGIRLAGAQPLARTAERQTAELPSEGTVVGALQVPPNGQPVLFLADHPLTGGYPVIGAVAHAHLDLAAQIPVGARVRLRPLTPFAELTPSPASESSPS